MVCALIEIQGNGKLWTIAQKSRLQHYAGRTNADSKGADVDLGFGPAKRQESNPNGIH
jgi:hypothetical protein